MEESKLDKLIALLEEYRTDQTYSKGPLINVYTHLYAEAEKNENYAARRTAALYRAIADAVKEQVQ